MENKRIGNDANVSDDDDDEVRLPADTLAILGKFLQEREEQQQTESDGIFEENWQLSQFWYDEPTKHTLAKVCLRLIHDMDEAPADIRVALLCCPSLYKTIKSVHPYGTVRLFEFDERFTSFGPDFQPFDYKQATQPDYLAEFAESFDVIIGDPPFLAEECIALVAKVVNRIRKPNAKIIFCSGATIAEQISSHLALNKCAFQPKHQRNLANEFCSYANFYLDGFV